MGDKNTEKDRYDLRAKKVLELAEYASPIGLPEYFQQAVDSYKNLLAATTATKTEDSDNSSDDTDSEARENLGGATGGMHLVEKILKGNPDEGVKAMGRHAKIIRLGRSLWGPTSGIKLGATHTGALLR